jgi:hypothetical protein
VPYVPCCPRRLLLLIAIAPATSCSYLDVRRAEERPWLTGAVDAVSAAPPVEHRNQLSVRKSKPAPEGPAAFRYFLNTIRAPFLPVAAAAELVGAGLEGTVGRTIP